MITLFLVMIGILTISEARATEIYNLNINKTIFFEGEALEASFEINQNEIDYGEYIVYLSFQSVQGCKEVFPIGDFYFEKGINEFFIRYVFDNSEIEYGEYDILVISKEDYREYEIFTKLNFIPRIENLFLDQSIRKENFKNNTERNSSNLSNLYIGCTVLGTYQYEIIKSSYSFINPVNATKVLHWLLDSEGEILAVKFVLLIKEFNSIPYVKARYFPEDDWINYENVFDADLEVGDTALSIIKFKKSINHSFAMPGFEIDYGDMGEGYYAGVKVSCKIIQNGQDFYLYCMMDELSSMTDSPLYQLVSKLEDALIVVKNYLIKKDKEVYKFPDYSLKSNLLSIDYGSEKKAVEYY